MFLSSHERTLLVDLLLFLVKYPAVYLLRKDGIATARFYSQPCL
jgi:hypothetical protein